MKQSNKTEWAIWGVCALSFAVTLALLPLLPARIPVHWNVDGQIDGWAAMMVWLFQSPSTSFR